MFVVRPVSADDTQPLFDLIQRSEYGLSTLKISREKLDARVEQSMIAFAQTAAAPTGQPYVFVMEDTASGSIIGTSAIYSKVGGFQPFYTYEIKTAIHHSDDLDVHKEIEYLSLCKIHNGPTEIGSLFLSPDYWGQGHGRALSIGRFLFMAEFPGRFETETIAELRGVVNADGHSPFWDAVGAHFFQINYPRAETLTSESKSFIADLMPTHPIYIPLLPESAQAVIGQVHRNTRPALVLLEREGFEYRGFVDIFDAGPSLHCSTNQIRAARDSRRVKIGAIRPTLEADRQLICNCSLEFRATMGPVERVAGQEIAIDEATALRLGLRLGNDARTVPLRPPRPPAPA